MVPVVILGFLMAWAAFEGAAREAHSVFLLNLRYQKDNNSSG